MYLPPHFRESDLSVIHEMMRRFPFATFITHGSAGFQVSHVPMLIDPNRGSQGTLLFHVARANPQWRTVTGETEAMIIFLGPDAYLSPTYYITKQETGKVVPTWDYVAIHAYGRLKVLDDPNAARDVVARLTTEHEGKQQKPWR